MEACGREEETGSTKVETNAHLCSRVKAAQSALSAGIYAIMENHGRIKDNYFHPTV